MPDSGNVTVTGHGEYLLPGGVLITWLLFYISTPSAEVDYRSQTRPARTMHAGWIATASGLTGVASAGLSFDDLQVSSVHYFDFEANIKNNPSGFIYDDRIIYNLGAGVAATFKVFW